MDALVLLLAMPTMGAPPKDEPLLPKALLPLLLLLPKPLLPVLLPPKLLPLLLLPKLLPLLLPPKLLLLPNPGVLPRPVPDVPDAELPEESVPDVVEVPESVELLDELDVLPAIGVPTVGAYIPPDAATPPPGTLTPAAVPPPSTLPPAAVPAPPMGCPKRPRGCTCASPKWMSFQSSLPVMGST